MRLGLENVSFAYGDKPVLEHFSLELPERGGVCLFGPSGCGKTTALRLLAGLETPQAGRALGLREKRVAVMFQEDRLLPWYTLTENLLLCMQDARPVKAREWLEAVGLAAEADRKPGELSGGMRRRVALARALARGGDVLLLDEPLKELDDATALRMRDLIRRHAQGKLLVLVTHNRQEADALCDATVILHPAHAPRAR